MKISIKILIFGIASLLSIVNISAQNKSYIDNNIIIWGTGGQSALTSVLPAINSTWGLGYGVGAGYEFQYKNFSILTGVEYTHLKPSLKLDNFSIDVSNLIDSEGDRFLGHYTFSNNSDKYSLGNINFPLEFGFRSNLFYFLAGLKVGMNILAKSKTESLVSFSGTYENYLGTFENMPNHSFGSFNPINEYQPIISLNCSATAEAGVTFGNKTKYRLGVFFDYGLLNVNGNALQSLVLYKPDNIPYLNNYLTGLGTPASIMYGGLKFTVLLKLNKKTDCKCDNVATKSRIRR